MKKRYSFNPVMIIVLCFLLASDIMAQYDLEWSKELQARPLFKEIKRVFNERTIDSMHVISAKINGHDVKCCLYDTHSKGKSSYFLIDEQKLETAKVFDGLPTEDLCDRFFKVYTCNFQHRKYLLILTNYSDNHLCQYDVLCNLFDVTDKLHIMYFPLWSVYGGARCFGDFNHDGKLDFLKIRRIEGNDFRCKITLITLENEKFQPLDQDKHFIIFEFPENLKFKYRRLQKEWFR
jgi:hypothetical protein